MPSRTISQVITTVSSTPCWKSGRPEPRGLRAWLGWGPLLVVALVMALWLPAAVRADTPVELDALKLERSDDGVLLSMNVLFELPDIVEDAMHKGIAMHFVAEADLYQERWYWYDRKVATASRYMRLAYQPLTRRWRLNISPSPIVNTGLGLTLGQTFDSLPEALGAVQRIARWRIADASAAESGAEHNLEARFRLDTSQLPRPIQIGVAGQSDWNIAVARRARLKVEAER
ncbi:MAG: DUF4390 domain-containing protein [Rubrivivax sp.]|nr:MAG: DUF4390 domain-containing protein [Rubrivivax sp.]